MRARRVGLLEGVLRLWRSELRVGGLLVVVRLLMRRGSRSGWREVLLLLLEAVRLVAGGRVKRAIRRRLGVAGSRWAIVLRRRVLRGRWRLLGWLLDVRAVELGRPLPNGTATI